MTEAELNEIQARAAGATAGPWFEVVEPDGEMLPDGSGGIDGYVETGAIGAPPEGAEDPPTIADGVEHPGNRAFIKHAREDVPALVKAVREVRLDAEAGWRSALLLAVQYGARGTERAARAALVALGAEP